MGRNIVQHSANMDTGKKKINSRLGLGTLRLPLLAAENPPIPDVEEIRKIVETAGEYGVRYFDCAPTYCAGRCEEVIGKVIAELGEPRESWLIASKIPLDVIHKPGDFRHYLKLSLGRLRMDYLDYYFLWALNKKELQKKTADEELLRELNTLKQEGLIRHLGFFYHDRPEYIPFIFERAEKLGIHFDAVLFQYNMVDRRMEGQIPYAKAQGAAVFVMGAAAGGKPDPFLAYEFVLDHPGVDMLLTGADTAAHLKEIVDWLSRKERENGTARPDGAAERQRNQQDIEVEKRKKDFLTKLYCTGCGYCMPCPMGIDIPSYMAHCQEAIGKAESGEEPGRTKIFDLRDTDIQPKEICVGCRKCESKCPQHIEITGWIKNGIDGSGLPI